MEPTESQSDTREKILEAALNLFSKHGFHASTTRAIARKADVNEVTLFRLFNSKQELFNNILQHVKQVGTGLKRPEQFKDRPEEAIRYICTNTLEIMENHPREYRIMHHAILDDVDDFEEDFIRENQAELLRFLENAFITLKKRDRLKPDIDPVLLAHIFQCTLMGLASGRILSRAFPVKNLDREVISDGMMNLFLKSC